MKAGDIVLARIPQADNQFKLRPALVLCLLPPFADFLVCGVSTQLRHEVEGFDEMVVPADALLLSRSAEHAVGKAPAPVPSAASIQFHRAAGAMPRLRRQVSPVSCQAYPKISNGAALSSRPFNGAALT